MLQSYWEQIPGMWVHGDIAIRHEDGSFEVPGRSDDVLNVVGKLRRRIVRGELARGWPAAPRVGADGAVRSVAPHAPGGVPGAAVRGLISVRREARGGARKDTGSRSDLEAGMAKYLANEFCKEVLEDSFRIHGGNGYSTEYEIERPYRGGADVADR